MKTIFQDNFSFSCFQKFAVWYIIIMVLIMTVVFILVHMCLLKISVRPNITSILMAICSLNICGFHCNLRLARVTFFKQETQIILLSLLLKANILLNLFVINLQNEIEYLPKTAQ